MCWNTTCETAASATPSPIPASDTPSPWIHSTFRKVEFSFRAIASISDDTSSALTDRTRPASTRVRRPTPQPISTTTPSGSNTTSTAPSKRSRSSRPIAQKRRSSAGSLYLIRLSTKKNASSRARSSQNSCMPAIAAAMLNRGGQNGGVRHPAPTRDHRGERRVRQCPRAAYATPRVAGSERHRVRPHRALDAETGRFDHCPQTGWVRDLPLRLMSGAKPRGGPPRREQGQHRIDLLGGQKLPCADRPNCLQRPHRVLQVQHQRAADDDVELT